MHARRTISCLLLALTLAAPLRAIASTEAPASLASALALETPSLAPVDPTLELFGRGGKPKASRAPRVEHEPQALGADRARILLRSLTIPGWGQATLGARRSAAVFAIAEAGIWTSFTAFRVQQAMRRNTYERTAKLYANVDLDGRDEEFLRTVGSYLSSEEYNQLVVTRDAANIYLSDPDALDIPGYRTYIERNSLSGKNTWDWGDVDNLLRFRSQRKDAQRASLRANTALALAIGNRLLSVVHAARIAGRPAATTRTSWNLECVPSDAADPTAFHLGVRARF